MPGYARTGAKDPRSGPVASISLRTPRRGKKLWADARAAPANDGDGPLAQAATFHERDLGAHPRLHLALQPLSERFQMHSE